MTEAAQSTLTQYLMTDLGGITRGRGVWARTDENPKHSVGWVPVNQMITPFDTIAAPNPWGSHGDRRLYADPSTKIDVALSDGRRIRLYLCDVGELDGGAWDVCARTFLKRALQALKAHGLQVRAAFEQEFWLTMRGCEVSPSPGFSYARFMAHEPFGTEVMTVLENAGMEPEMLLPEFAPEQFELTLKPASGLIAADRAVVSRELVRLAASAAQRSVSFTPVRVAGGIGSGIHIHLSLWDLSGCPVTYEEGRPGGLSETAASFAGGLVRHMQSLCALTAPSTISYERLQPQRWSSAYTCMGDRNREATLRICPIVKSSKAPANEQFNLEWRASDATANPYLALGALVWAGIDGLRDALPAPPLVNEDPSVLSDAVRSAKGIVRLPTSLKSAISLLRANTKARIWMSDSLFEAYLTVKESEIAFADGLPSEEVIRRYGQIF